MSKEYYERIAILGQYILNRVNEFNPDISLQDNMQSAIALGPNPYRPEIDDDGSLLLEFAYGLPSRFYTPLGSFDFCGESEMKEGKSDIGARVVSEFVSRLGLIEVIPAGKAEKKHIGPILSVGNDLNGKAFAKSQITSMPKAMSYDDYIDFNERRAIWDEIKPNLEEIRQQAKEFTFDTE